MDPKDLFVADLHYFGESMHHNDEVGEKRFSFFVGLCTSVAAGLIALAAGQSPEVRALVAPVGAVASAVLLILGILTYVRMIHRNDVTDMYKLTLDHIRKSYSRCVNENRTIMDEYCVPRPIDRSKKRLRFRSPRGGYASTMAIINGLLVIALLWLTIERLSFSVIAAIGAVVAVGLYVIAGRRIEIEPSDDRRVKDTNTVDF